MDSAQGKALGSLLQASLSPDCFQPGEGGCCARKGSKAGVTAVQGLILGFAGVETQRRPLIRETANPGELFCSIEIQQEPGLCLERQSLI